MVIKRAKKARSSIHVTTKKKNKPMESDVAYTKMAFICSKREYCSFQVVEKLRAWGMEDESKIKNVIDKLVADKFLDDLRFANAYVNDKIKYNHWGRLKVRFMLRQLLLHGKWLDTILDDFDHTIYEQIAKDVLISKFHSLKETDKYKLRLKLMRFMSGRGFELEAYCKELDILLNNKAVD
ncbi:MAG: regulatory protein RecX [Bacteroidales bacterium]